MNRRGFLKLLGLTAIVATSVVLPELQAKEVEKSVEKYLTLHGDGIHDDTDALRALVDGEQVILNGELIDGAIWNGYTNVLYIPSGTYKVSSSIKFDGDWTIDGGNSKFISIKDAPVFNFTSRVPTFNSNISVISAEAYQLNKTSKYIPKLFPNNINYLEKYGLV